MSAPPSSTRASVPLHLSPALPMVCICVTTIRTQAPLTILLSALFHPSPLVCFVERAFATCATSCTAVALRKRWRSGIAVCKHSHGMKTLRERVAEHATSLRVRWFMIDEKKRRGGLVAAAALLLLVILVWSGALHKAVYGRNGPVYPTTQGLVHKIAAEVERKGLAAPKVHVFVNVYRPKATTRRGELLASLEETLANPLVESVHVYGSESDLSWFNNHPKIIKNEWDDRPLFADFFGWMARVPEGSISVLINTDTFLPLSRGLQQVIDIAPWLREKKAVFALSRWEMDAVGKLESLFDRGDTQDAWMFFSPPSEALVKGAEFYLGQSGCDNRLAALFRETGYKLHNPAWDVILGHLHLSSVRNMATWADQVKGDYCTLYPYTLAEAVELLNARQEPVYHCWKH